MDKIKKIKVIVFRFFFKCLVSLLSRFMRPDFDLIIFGAMNGNWYGDNSCHLYEWILCNRPDLKPLWLTKNISVYRTLVRQKKPTSLLWFGGLFYLIKARVACFTNSLRDIAIHPFAVPENLDLIALRHGRSVKRIRFARLHHKISETEALERRFEGERIRFAISTSEFISDIQEECLSIGRSKHIVTGYPRNDKLFSPPLIDKKIWDQFLGGRKFKKVVLYAPSWRHGRNHTRFFPFDDFDVNNLGEFLESRSTLLLLRPHVAELANSSLKEYLDNLCQASEFIQFCSHEEFSDVNTMLPFVDVLISDYSALFHDFLLLDRPLLFVPYDYSDFCKQNGFLYDYYKNLPGPSITSYSGLCTILDDILQGIDKFKNMRKKLTDMIHKYQDNGSSSRVTQLIDTIVIENKNKKNNSAINKDDHGCMV